MKIARILDRAAPIAPALALALVKSRQAVEQRSVNARDILILCALAALLGASATKRYGALLERAGGMLRRELGTPMCLALAAGLALLASGPDAALFAGAALGCALLALNGALAERHSDPPRARRRLFLLAIWCVSLVALEFTVARFVLPRRSHDKVFMEHDPVLGWRLRPNFSVTRKERDYHSRESTNSLGFRTPERAFQAAPGVQRVLLLGDSHSEGYTVDDDETVASLLEQALGQQVEVISLGVGGYSTDQELLAYLEVGRRFQPDLVVLQFCSNDLPFNVQDHYWRGYKPRFVRTGELLTLRGVPVPNAKSSGVVPDWLARRSSLMAFVETQLRQIALQRTVEVETDMPEAWRVTELLVRDLARAVHGDGAELACFNVQVHDRELDERLRDLLARQAVKYLDLSPTLGVKSGDVWVSGHWNEVGQQLAAQALLGPIAELLAGRK